MSINRLRQLVLAALLVSVSLSSLAYGKCRHSEDWKPRPGKDGEPRSVKAYQCDQARFCEIDSAGQIRIIIISGPYTGSYEKRDGKELHYSGCNMMTNAKHISASLCTACHNKVIF